METNNLDRVTPSETVSVSLSKEGILNQMNQKNRCVLQTNCIKVLMKPDHNTVDVKCSSSDMQCTKSALIQSAGHTVSDQPARIIMAFVARLQNQ